MTTDDIPDYYAEFDIDRSATRDEVSRRLDRASRTWQSRASRAPDASKRWEAETKVGLIKEARKELLDPARRQVYDRKLDEKRQHAGPTAESVPAPPPSPPRDTRDWVGQARRLIDRGDVEGALYELRQAVHHDAGNADAWRMLGALHLEGGQLSDAIQELQRALALHPHDALAHSLTAQVYEKAGDFVNAAVWYAATARHTPDAIGSQLNAANCLYREGRYDEALASYERILAERPGDAQIADQIGRIWSLRACAAMAWHPDKARYVVASADSVPTVRFCVDQALAVGISDTTLRGQLIAHQLEADKALGRTWRWYGGSGKLMILCAALVVLAPVPAPQLAGLVGFFGLPIMLGIKPRWKHNYYDLYSPDRRARTGRDT